MARVEPEREWAATVSNRILEALYRTDLSSRECKAVLYVVRWTYGMAEKDRHGNLVRSGNGFVRKRKMVSVNLEVMAKETGMRKEHCCRTLQRLVNRSILKKEVAGSGNAKHVRYGLQKDYDLWKGLPVSAIVASSGNGRCQYRQHIEDILKKKHKVKASDFSDEIQALAKILETSIRKNVPSHRFKPDLETWQGRTCQILDRIVRLDSHEVDEVRETLEWVRLDSRPVEKRGDFPGWGCVVQSAGKFREQYSTIRPHVDNGHKETAGWLGA